MKRALQITRLHLEILYHLTSDRFISQIKSNGCKIKLNGNNNIENKQYNLVKLLKSYSPLFFNEFHYSNIKESIIEIIKATHKNNRKNNKIFKLSKRNIDIFINENNILL
jgi:hypothetical protein